MKSKIQRAIERITLTARLLACLSLFGLLLLITPALALEELYARNNQ